MEQKKRVMKYSTKLVSIDALFFMIHWGKPLIYKKVKYLKFFNQTQQAEQEDSLHGSVHNK